ncbi:MAG: PKD domain-containing protein, partial [Chitinivibrionales bacterium]|nr:PKD domain-containing protein [Chitinivibrionales bacterium]
TVSANAAATEGTIIPHINAGAGIDAAANASLASTSTDNSVTYNTPPDNVTNFVAKSIGGDQVKLTWTPSSSHDAELVMICYRSDGSYPADPSDGDLWFYYAADEMPDTVFGLAEKSLYYFGAFVKDTSGNWSAATTGARDTAHIPDYTPPANVTDFYATQIDSATIVLNWRYYGGELDKDSLVVRYRTGSMSYPLNQNDGVLAFRSDASLTADTIHGILQKTVYAFSAFVRDTSGMWSPYSVMAASSIVTADYTPPVNVTNFAAQNLGGGTVALAWTPSISTDVVSVYVCYRDDGVYAATPYDAFWFDLLDAGAVHDTLLWLPEKKFYNLSIFTVDSSGNCSPAIASSQSVIYIPDYTPPQNPLIMAFDAFGYSSGPFLTVNLWASGADSMRVAFAGDTVGAPWRAYSENDSVPLSAQHVGPLNICAQFKDSAGNRSVWCSAVTYYDNIIPTVVLDTKGQFGVSSWPGAISGSAADAQSGVMSVWLMIRDEQTGLYWDGANWSNDSTTIVLADGTNSWSYGFIPIDQGNYSLITFAQDSALNISDIATTQITYLGAPKAHFSAVPLTGAAPLAVNFTDSSLNGPVAVRWDYGDNTGDTARTVSHVYSQAGSYKVRLIATSLVGSDTAYQTVLVNDTTPPDPALLRRVTADNCSTLTVLFTPSPSADVDSVYIFISGDTAQAALWRVALTNQDSSAQITGLPAYGATIVVSLLTADVSGNAAQTDSSQDIAVRLADCVPPQNSLKLSFAGIGDTALAVGWTVDKTVASDVRDVRYAMGYGAITLDPNKAVIMPCRDTNFMIPNIYRHGAWSLAAVLTDSSDNVSTVLNVSAIIKNTPPKLTPVKDTTIVNKLLWTAVSSGTDINGDTLRYALLSAPATMQINAGNGIISWTPVRADTGRHTIIVAADDNNGGMAYDTFAVTVLHINEAPNTILDKREVSGGAVRYSVHGVDDLDSGITFKALLISASDTGFALRKDTVLSPISFLPLVDGTYYCTIAARDAGGLLDSTPVRDTLVIANVSTRTWLPDSVWQMISVPAAQYNATTLAKKGALAYWDESAAERPVYGNYRTGSDIPSLIQGQSYWYRGTDSATVKVVSANCVTGSENLPLIKGKYGWNQISSPYLYPVSWNGPTLWRWDATTRDYISDENILQPWQGYWVLADSSRKIALSNAPLFGAAAKGQAKKRIAYSRSRDEWQVQVILTAGTSGDADNRLGFSDRASDGYNQLDRPEPPRMGGEPYLFFGHPEWQRPIKEYSADIRRNFQSVNIFSVGISPADRKTAVCSLRVDGAQELPGVYLFIADADSVVAYNPKAPYLLVAKKETQYRTIFVTDQKDFLANYPRAFAIGNPYPNPMRPMAHIGYTLPYRFEQNGLIINRPFTVSMVLYDLRGRVVRTLINRSQNPGKYTVLWDGKSNNGMRVAAGNYICLLKADSFKGHARFVMLH